MTFNVFRAKKIIKGKTYTSRTYRGRYRLDSQEKVQDVPLNTSDKRVAIKRLEEIVREKQLEAVGILPPAAIRSASQCDLGEHAAEFLEDLRALGRSQKHVKDLNQLHLLMRE